MKPFKYIILCVVAVALFLAANRLLMPKHMSHTPLEGRLTAEFYFSNKRHSVIFLGDCEVFSTFSPPHLWREFGVPSHVRGGPQQLVWHSYYILRDTLLYNVPDVVVFSVLAMQHGEPQSEAYNRLNLAGIRSWRIRRAAVRSSMMEDENVISYFIPILRYKDRWRDLGREDFEFFFRYDRVSHNGFMMRADIQPLGFVDPPVMRLDYSFSDMAFEYLERIRRLCEEYGIELVLIKAPTVFPQWLAGWEAQIVEYAEKNNLLYVNLLALADEIGLDFALDTWNAGFHLNVYGAEKTTYFLGRILIETFSLADRRGGDLDSYWDEILYHYDRMKAVQEAEFAKYGIIRTLTHRR
ncbi:MAG: SGNH/GDSL hydrolase family protein [Defluviitaleaceae bacterium]|nr:SGNH/GDSL hydrolase family protein [Defluviitaleaceae bacterium]